MLLTTDSFPRLRLVQAAHSRVLGATRPQNRSQTGRLRVYCPNTPEGCSSFKLFNLITKNPPKPAPLNDNPPLSHSSERVAPAPVPKSVAQSRALGGFQPRFSLQFLLDTSGSVCPFQDLINTGVRMFVSPLASDPLIGSLVEIQVLAFNSRVVSTPFVPLADYNHIPLMPVGSGTCLGLALNSALDSLIKRLSELRSQGVPIIQKVLIVLTDGHTFDSMQVATPRLHTVEKEECLHVLPVGVGDVNVAVMESLSSRHKPLYLRSDGGAPDYDGLFRWLKKVIRVYSTSQPNTDPDLPSADDIRR